MEKIKFYLSPEEIFKLYVTDIVFQIATKQRVLTYEEKVLGFNVIEEDLRAFIKDFAQIIENVSGFVLMDKHKKELICDSQAMSDCLDAIEMKCLTTKKENDKDKYIFKIKSLKDVDFDFKYLADLPSKLAEFYFVKKFQKKFEELETKQIEHKNDDNNNDDSGNHNQA